VSDAAKSDAEVQQIRAENHQTSERGRGYTGPERVTSRPTRTIADAAARRQRALLRTGSPVGNSSELLADEIVAAISKPDDDGGEHLSELLAIALAKDRQALQLASDKLGELYDMTALRAVALDCARELLFPTWRTMPRASLGDVLKVVDAETKRKVVTMLHSAGWDTSNIG
jgi:hypothetical protein